MPDSHNLGPLIDSISRTNIPQQGQTPRILKLMHICGINQKSFSFFKISERVYCPHATIKEITLIFSSFPSTFPTFPSLLIDEPTLENKMFFVQTALSKNPDRRECVCF